MKLRGLTGPDFDLPLPKYDPASTIKDGYSAICPHCMARHGEAKTGCRTLDVKECQKCIEWNNPPPVNPKNSSKILEAAYLKTQPDTSYLVRRCVDIVTDKNGRRIYRSVEHLL